jgi:glycerol-3-phosphate acyltransferase PlsY
LFGFHGLVGASTAGTWLLIAKGFKISSLAALIATLLAPLYVWLIIGPSPELIIITALMTLILFWRHRSNIQRLLKGEEGLISKKN